MYNSIAYVCDLHGVTESTVEVPANHCWGVVNVKLTGNLGDTLD